jgi:hypothetical protein
MMYNEKTPIEPIIKKENLIHGAYYRGKCRNADVARWDGTNECFWHWRYKFGLFTEQIKCPEDDDYYDVFVAERMLATEDVVLDAIIPLEHVDK